MLRGQKYDLYATSPSGSSRVAEGLALSDVAELIRGYDGAAVVSFELRVRNLPLHRYVRVTRAGRFNA